MKSVPLHLLIESQEHVVSVELSNGVTYRGRLVKSEDNMNLQLADVLATSREGAKQHMNSVFVRGSHIQMVILPELMRYAPVLRPDLSMKAKTGAKQRKPLPKSRKPPRKQARTA